MTKRHRPTKVDQLPEPIRHTVGRLLAANHSIDDVVAHLRQLEAAGEVFDMPSRSGVGRYAERLRAAQERIGRSRAIAEAMSAKFGEKPDNEVGRMAAEMLQAVILELLTAVEIDEDTGEAKPVTLGPKEAQSLAKSLQSLASAQKIDTDRIITVKNETKREAAKAAEKVATEKGLTAETVAAIRSAVLGIA